MGLIDAQVGSNFKESVVGQIPLDWKAVPFTEVCDLKHGHQFRTVDFVKRGQGVKVIKIGNVHSTKLNVDDCDEVHIYLSQSLSGFKLIAGDILMSLTGNIGRVARVPENPPLLLQNYRVGRFVPNNRIDPSYLTLNLGSATTVAQLVALSNQAAQANFGKSDFNKVFLPLPPTLTEQKAIATALSDVDALIASLDKLIEKKKAIKQGVMQELLTPPQNGGKQLGSFTGKWSRTFLGNLCSITTGKLDANAMVPDGEYRFYTCAKDFYYIDEYAFDCDALLISGNGANVGYIHHYYGKFNAYQRTYVLSEFSGHTRFLKYLLEVHLANRIASEKNEGNTPYILRGTLSEMNLVLPNDIMEQEAIANCLDDISFELDSLTSKKRKLVLLKHGMMQELLTGKTRLV